MAGTPEHWLALAICAFLIFATLWLARRRRIRRQLAGAVLGFWVVMQIWYLLPGNFKPDESWPLHVCDLANVIGPMALLFRWRWARGVLVFWGIGLTTQGFITPVLQEGSGHPAFWLFWLNHTLVLTMALHEVIVDGFRPTRRDVVTVIAISAAYVALVFAIDAATGWNYGFVGPTRPTTRTLVDALGPWPLRVLWMMLIVAGWFGVMGAVLGRVPGGERGVSGAR